MSLLALSQANVDAVLLADGWHQLDAGSMTVENLSFDTNPITSTGRAIWWKENGQPFVAPIDSVLAYRQRR